MGATETFRKRGKVGVQGLPKNWKGTLSAFQRETVKKNQFSNQIQWPLLDSRGNEFEVKHCIIYYKLYYLPCSLLLPGCSNQYRKKKVCVTMSGVLNSLRQFEISVRILLKIFQGPMSGLVQFRKLHGDVKHTYFLPSNKLIL